MKTTVARNITDPLKPVVEITRIERGEKIINIDNAVAATMVAWGLKLANVPYEMRHLSSEEAQKEWDIQVAATLGSGI